MTILSKMVKMSDWSQVDPNAENSGADNPDAEEMKKMNALHERILAGNSNTDETTKGIFQLLMKFLPTIKECQKQLITLKNEVEELKNENRSMKMELLESQIEKSAKSVVIRGVPVKNSTKNESLLDSKEAFEKITAEMKVETKVKCLDAYRLIGKDVSENYANEPPPLKVELGSKMERLIFFKNLKHLKRFKNIKVSADVPKALLTSYRRLEKAAFDLRKAQKGTKTMILIQNEQYILLVKKPNEEKFSQVIDVE